MTAVEWLVSQLNKKGFAQVVTDEEIEKAKEMEKQQIIDANLSGFNEGCRYLSNEKLQFETAEQYYNETFKNTNK